MCYNFDRLHSFGTMFYKIMSNLSHTFEGKVPNANLFYNLCDVQLINYVCGPSYN